MADQIRYDLLTQQALRGVVHSVLTDTARKACRGITIYVLSFDTKADGVHMSDRLRTQYPGGDRRSPPASILGFESQRRRV